MIWEHIQATFPLCLVSECNDEQDATLSQGPTRDAPNIRVPRK